MKPRFFSKYEWWYHLAMMPVLFAVGNYYFIGKIYFQDIDIFLKATVLVFFLYWFSVVTLTWVVRGIINRYPNVDQTRRRLAVMLLAVGSLTVLLATFDVWAYSITPGLGVSFTWQAIWPIIVLGAFFDVFLCAMLGLFYSLEQWKKNQAENEKLERIALETQFNALRGQVNPHFLFNSLNTLSSLIGEDQEQAEHFVEDLAKVYRYTLQAAKSDLVTLQAELQFAETYVRLLHVRYGESLVILLPPATTTDLSLPPLALQILIDNAIKYNVMSPARPLVIDIVINSQRRLIVSNNFQPKVRAVATNHAGLRELNAKYALISRREVEVQQQEGHFVVSLPLLTEFVRAGA
jgi:sensor histidine kinase YesM